MEKWYRVRVHEDKFVITTNDEELAKYLDKIQFDQTRIKNLGSWLDEHFDDKEDEDNELDYVQYDDYEDCGD